ncbi:Neuropeptide W [Manis pentadactyla]|nr:Neuropeptide W [Manis pentadactyla]
MGPHSGAVEPRPPSCPSTASTCLFQLYTQEPLNNFSETGMPKTSGILNGSRTYERLRSAWGRTVLASRNQASHGAAGLLARASLSKEPVAVDEMELHPALSQEYYIFICIVNIQLGLTVESEERVDCI